MLAPYFLGINPNRRCPDLNDFQSLGQTTSASTFYPVSSQGCAPSDGKLCRWTAMILLRFTRPNHESIRDEAFFMLNSRTTKRQGVSFMEKVLCGHYPLSDAEEYQAALKN